MKIAVCLSGKFTGKNDSGQVQGFRKPYEYLEKNIIKGNDVDVFIHGWDDNPNDSEGLLNLYKPKKHILEKQVTFRHDYNFTTTGPSQTQYMDRNYSRFYSFKKCVELVDLEEYDIIFWCRFDTVFYQKIDFTTINPMNLYTSNWHPSHRDWGFNDGYFIGGPKIMKEYSLIYDRLDDYFNIDGNSDYYKFTLKHGFNKTNLQSMHIISRYRAKELGWDDKLYGVGDYQKQSWCLLRSLNPKLSKDSYVDTPKKMY